jgi:hypothetical protein
MPRLASSTDLEPVRARNPGREQSNIAANTDALVCNQFGTWLYSDAVLLLGVSYIAALTTQPSLHGYLREELGTQIKYGRLHILLLLGRCALLPRPLFVKGGAMCADLGHTGGFTTTFVLAPRTTTSHHGGCGL